MISTEEAREYIKKNSTFSYYPEINKISLRLELGPFTYVFSNHSYDKLIDSVLPIAIKRIQPND